MNSRLKVAGMVEKRSDEKGTERSNDCLAGNHLGRSKKKEPWIDKSFVNLLRGNTSDRKWNQGISHKT